MCTQKNAQTKSTKDQTRRKKKPNVPTNGWEANQLHVLFVKTDSGTTRSTWTNFQIVSRVHTDTHTQTAISHFPGLIYASLPSPFYMLHLLLALAVPVRTNSIFFKASYSLLTHTSINKCCYSHITFFPQLELGSCKEKKLNLWMILSPKNLENYSKEANNNLND